MKRLVLAMMGSILIAVPVAIADEAGLLNKAGKAFTDLMQAPDAKVPVQLQQRARCIAVFPGVIKGALGWGARAGHGVISCRRTDGSWSEPVFLTISGGSFGLQAGISKTDLVLFFMSENAAHDLMKNQFTLGAKGSVVAGPVGRTAEASTDARLDAEIYAYGRAKGLFAGISIEGARVHVDQTKNREFYGRSVTPEEVAFGSGISHPPAATSAFIGVLPR